MNSESERRLGIFLVGWGASHLPIFIALWSIEQSIYLILYGTLGILLFVLGSGILVGYTKERRLAK